VKLHHRSAIHGTTDANQTIHRLNGSVIGGKAVSIASEEATEGFVLYLNERIDVAWKNGRWAEISSRPIRRTK
jgi:hypothetical protein